MKKLIGVTATGLLAVVLVGCTTPAGPNQRAGAVLGGATGAVLGGVIGHNSGHHGGHTGEGAIIGGVIGALAGALVGRDIDDSTRMHVEQGQPLTVQDVVSLSKAGVKDDLIIGQINSTRTVYQLSAAQIIDLKNQGVSDGVVDYMIRTPVAFSQPVPASVRETHYYAVPAPYPYYYYYRHVPHRRHFYNGPSHWRR